MTPDDLVPGDALLVVDVQNDFCPGGALPIPDGDRVVPVLDRWIGAARAAGVPIFVSRDWHPEGHPSFASAGGLWPRHCVQDTAGARFHPGLALPDDAVMVTKGTRFDKDQYSAFDETGLDTRLKRDGVRRLWVGGLAQDVCVMHTVLDARRLGYEVLLVPGGSMPVVAADGISAVRRMREAGAQCAVEDGG